VAKFPVVAGGVRCRRGPAERQVVRMNIEIKIDRPNAIRTDIATHWNGSRNVLTSSEATSA